MTPFLDKAALLGALTGTHEKAVDVPLVGRVLLREIPARIRIVAQQEARRDDPDQVDDALYMALMVGHSLVDPDSGTPGPDGRIDPRTRRPLLTPEEILLLADGRDLPMRFLFEEAIALAGVAPGALFRGDTRADPPQRDAGAGAPDRPTDAPGDADEGARDGDGRADADPADDGSPRPAAA